MGNISSLVKRSLHGIGLDVRLCRNIDKAERRAWEDKWCAYWRPFIAHRKIKTVIDIGANTGQFAMLFHRLCPDVRIISLEPLQDCFDALKNNIASIPVASAHRLAIGSVTGVADMNRTEFTPCSSFLETTGQLKTEFGEGGAARPESVNVVRLDDFMAGLDVPDELMIKMDVQGYELEVLKGGPATFQRAVLVATEVCFFPKLYKNQPLFDDIYRALRSHGFSYMGNPEQLAGKVDGRIAEADAVFERVS